MLKTTMKTLLSTFAVLGLSYTLLAQAPVMLSDFEGYTNGATVIFRQPSFSGSTSANLDATPNFSGVTNAFPAGNANSGAGVYNTLFSFASSAATPWLRLTSNGANPAIPFTGEIKFDMFTDRPLYVALLIRETGKDVAIGANGGTSGTIEFVGGTPSATADKGHLVPANTWTTLDFNIPLESVTSFTGDGILRSTNTTVSPYDPNKGVLEALGFSPEAGASGVYNVYLDNLQVVPEPSVAALLGLGALALIARSRRQRA